MWQVLTGTATPPHIDPGFRSCFLNWDGDFVAPLPLPWLLDMSAGATTPALLPCRPWGKPPLEMVLQQGVCFTFLL